MRPRSRNVSSPPPQLRHFIGHLHLLRLEDPHRATRIDDEVARELALFVEDLDPRLLDDVCFLVRHRCLRPETRRHSYHSSIGCTSIPFFETMTSAPSGIQ